MQNSRFASSVSISREEKRRQLLQRDWLNLLTGLLQSDYKAPTSLGLRKIHLCPPNTPCSTERPSLRLRPCYAGHCRDL
ncbi:hypothetical protein Y1Q_0000233 [Alligator mississippiensis]|uniref:Uncharacterized protein n=1 Tax=Alligator mississippiensis TaxID=8496 RepID=A0A151P076_ALLMI|nr:hypothetical protein Y1Q_0000233 [Alligator mississippiensis]